MKRFLFCYCAAIAALAQSTTIDAGLILDGRGGILRNQRITIENGRITKVAPISKNGGKKGAIDLRGLTVTPGWIDTHVHLDWHFDPATNKLANRANESAQTLETFAAQNARVTLIAGFTTVQSVGSATDGVIRDRINKGEIPGPRVLTSLRQITNRSGDPQAIRELVRKTKAEGADLIKLFATAGLGAGGEQTMSYAQLEAGCGEAKAQGLRTLVHAISAKGAAASVRAGCTAIEHGDYVDEATLRLIADHGAYFDPNFLVLHNYLDLRDKFDFPAASFVALEKAIGDSANVLKLARKTNVKVVFGTDAVAGAHGRNAEEFIYRVREGGDKSADVLASATSVSAESLGLGKVIGTIAPGYAADLVAVDGNPLEDITAVRRVVFIMRNGIVIRNSR